MAKNKIKYFDLWEHTKQCEKEAGGFLHFIWVVSQRSTGKTFSFCYHVFEDWIKSGEVNQGMYVRRWSNDWDNLGARTIFNALMCDGNGENQIEKLSHGKYDRVDYKAGNFYVGKYDEKKDKTEWFREKVFCYGSSLNLQDKVKGTSTPHVMNIALDEALSTGMYLTHEKSYLDNLLSTVIRNREGVHVYLLANNISFASYCWEDWRLENDIPTMKQGETKYFEFYDEDNPDDDEPMRMSFTWLDFNNKQEKGAKKNLYWKFGTGTNRMISNGSWDIGSYDLLPIDIVETGIRPSEVMFMFFIKFNTAMFQAELVEKDGNRFTYVHKKTGDIKKPDEDIVFTDNLKDSYKVNYSFGFRQKNDKMHTKIKQYLDVYPVYFDTNLTGYLYWQYVNQTNDYTGSK